jgi:trk system potassium uptake protein TrkH
MGDTAKILYLIYGVLTAIEFLLLMAAGMNAYDAAIHAVGTAGTGGFSNYAASIGHFDSALIDAIITLFMVLFGVNFVIYYKMLLRDWQDIRANEELRWFLAIFLGATAIITLTLLPEEGNLFTALRYSSFQVASIISTTGYATANYDLWPLTARMLILVLLFFGSCAGSTAGGMKICRIGMLSKQAVREVRHTIQPRKAMVVRFEGKAVDEGVLRQVATFACIYVALILLGGFLLSLENRYDMMTNFSAALTCVSNVGPGFGAVGPAGSFAGYGPFGKLLASFLMLAGRLEIFPMLALFHPAMWRK